jgi:peptide/nickel transport system permease protein
MSTVEEVIAGPKTDVVSGRRSHASPALGITGACILGAMLLMSVFAPLISPWDPDSQDLTATLSAPSFESGHLLGTDQLGRDLLSRAMFGGQVALIVAFVTAAGAVAIGVILGLISGFRGRATDQVLGRLADVQLSIPTILLAILFLAFFGNSVPFLIAVLVIASWPGTYRIARSYALSVRSAGYVEAAQLAGSRTVGIIARHLLPGMIPLILVNFTILVSTTLLVVASLGFLGLGVPPPTPDWGAMVAAGQSQLAGAWWLAVVPGVCLFLTLVGTQLLGDWLAERFAVSGLARGSKS